MELETKIKIVFGMFVVAMLVLVLGFYRPWYIDECEKSGNTRTYCEMKFWSSR